VVRSPRAFPPHPYAVCLVIVLHNPKLKGAFHNGKVARQVVEQAGMDVNVLIDKLIRAACAEFTTFYYYTILRVIRLVSMAKA
jgi:hypothetical protein